MPPTLNSILQTDPDRIVLIQQTQSVTRARLAAVIESVTQQLEGNAPAKCLVWSPSAADVIAALLVCERLGLMLYIAHSYLAPELVETITEEQGIGVVFEQGMKLRRQQDSPCAGDFTVCLMTSGTTGLPKIARHRPDALLGRIRDRRAGGDEDRRWLLTYPPSSFAGLQVLLTSFIHGQVLFCPPDYAIPSLVSSAQEGSVTHVSGTPTFWRSVLMALGTGVQLPDLKQITVGGETVDQSTLDRLRGKFPQARITHIYASTEAGSVFAVNDEKEGFPATWLEQAVDGVELRVEDDVLWVRVPRVMLGYVSNHRSAIREDGWLCTGDRVRIEAGRVHFAGRLDQIINVGGSKVFPEDVETVIRQAPGVLDSIVSAMASPITGNVLMAEIVAEQGFETDEVRRHVASLCRTQLAPFQVPRVIRFVTEIERSASGKKLSVSAKKGIQ
jgi:acyl-coenzyme A synthetase/AMP-(fatty) acid ligase